MNGHFVISLDFEKYWGLIDSTTIENYKENLDNVDTVVEKLLKLSNDYNIKLTFACVGFLFNENKEAFLKNTPMTLPSYTNKNYDPYPLIETIGNNEDEDSYHYGLKSILKIKNDGHHEIGTHTYSHYYCLEENQNTDQFENDLKMAKKVAQNLGIDIKSIVFPRNQVNDEYLKICKQNGITSYRGHEKHAIYIPKPKKDSKSIIHRALRFSDAYINITGKHTYKLNELNHQGVVNIPSSYFLRPIKSQLKIFELLKLRRIKSVMTKAAKHNELFHIWFHPHNFGKDMNQNFYLLEELFKHYKMLNNKFNFGSVTMSELANKINNRLS